MKTISTTEARKNISQLVDRVRETGESFAIGRRGKPEALIIKFPKNLKSDTEEITLLSEYGGAFDWLEDEPDLYSVDDLEEKYV
jgi:prevent-host-death family protein